jgi:hypothetical protein
MNIALLIIFLICLLILPIYYKTKSFNSKSGVLLFVLGLSALSLRVFLFKQYQPLATLNKGTLLTSSLVLLIPFSLFLVSSLQEKRDVLRKRSGYFFRLLLGYLFFGALQQVFFLTVFTDCVYYLLPNHDAAFWVSVLYFLVFHLDFLQEMRKFLPCLIVFAILNTFVYLELGNILPQMFMHGVFGAILYTAFSKQDQLKKRLS